MVQSESRSRVTVEKPGGLRLDSADTYSKSALAICRESATAVWMGLADAPQANIWLWTHYANLLYDVIYATN